MENKGKRNEKNKIEVIHDDLVMMYGVYDQLWKATDSHNNVFFQLSQKATLPSYLAQLVGTI